MEPKSKLKNPVKSRVCGLFGGVRFPHPLLSKNALNPVKSRVPAFFIFAKNR
jgi:hypothetical protein